MNSRQSVGIDPQDLGAHPMTNALMGRRRHYGAKGSLAVRLADATGRTPGSASQRLYGKQSLRSDCVEFATICGEDARHAEYQALRHAMDSAYQGSTTEAWTPELVNEVSEKDAVEDAKLVAIQAKILTHDASPADLLDYQKTLMREISAKIRCYDAAGTLRHELQDAQRRGAK